VVAADAGPMQIQMREGKLGLNVRSPDYTAKWTANGNLPQRDFGPVSRDANRPGHRRISARRNFLVDVEIPRNDHFPAIPG
jgi:hypothetical protein